MPTPVSHFLADSSGLECPTLLQAFPSCLAGIDVGQPGLCGCQAGLIAGLLLLVIQHGDDRRQLAGLRQGCEPLG